MRWLETAPPSASPRGGRHDLGLVNFAFALRSCRCWRGRGRHHRGDAPRLRDRRRPRPRPRLRCASPSRSIAWPISVAGRADPLDAAADPDLLPVLRLPALGHRHRRLRRRRHGARHPLRRLLLGGLSRRLRQRRPRPVGGLGRAQPLALDAPSATSSSRRRSRRSCPRSATTSSRSSRRRRSSPPSPSLELMQTAKIIGSETFRYTEPITLVGVFFLVMSLISAAGIAPARTPPQPEACPMTRPRRPTAPGPLRQGRPSATAPAPCSTSSTSTSRRGEKVSIIGPSGSGKTTVLRDADDARADRRRRHLGRRRAAHPYGAERRAGPGRRPAHIRRMRAKIGMVFQHFNLFPHMTALQNCIEAPVTVLGCRKAEAAAARAGSCSHMVGLADKKDHYPASSPAASSSASPSPGRWPCGRR